MVHVTAVFSARLFCMFVHLMVITVAAATSLVSVIALTCEVPVPSPNEVTAPAEVVAVQHAAELVRHADELKTCSDAVNVMTVPTWRIPIAVVVTVSSAGTWYAPLLETAAEVQSIVEIS